jgi:hypothetical protein
MNNLISVSYECCSCGESNETLVDPSGGSRQTYTEDCTVCCRPNLLHIEISQEGDVQMDVESEA